ncbi:MAG: TlpA family protein disulfide reductase [Syntrophomonadaceae bacterium]|nr:TlpA family protein disulfide reductase [Syntrophomonadaceae bacterium]
MDEVLQLQPRINGWRDKYGFRLVIVSSDDPEELKSFMTTNQVVATVLLDPKYKAGEKYGVQAIPTSFFLDKDGNLIKQSVGWYGNKSVREVEDWLKNK